MTTHLENAVRRMHLGLLWGASLLVPRSKRSEWSREWRTELWYVLRECFSATSLNPNSRSVLEKGLHSGRTPSTPKQTP